MVELQVQFHKTTEKGYSCCSFIALVDKEA